MTEASRPRLRIRVSIAGSDPEIWRLIELDADLALDRVHPILQLAFGWRDRHLHAWLTEDPWAGRKPLRTMMPLPRRWIPLWLRDDGDEGESETEISIARALEVGSGLLYYEYDFGDGWVHRIELIEAFDDPAADAPAIVVRGQRRGPLEDSGGIGGYEQLLATLADPAADDHQHMRDWADWVSGPWAGFDPEAVDVDGINDALSRLGRSPSTETSALDELVHRLPGTLGADLRAFADAALRDAPEVDDATRVRMLEPYLWLLRRVGDEGITLTAAGWLPPVVVRDAMRELDWEWRDVGAMNREDRTVAIADLRANARRLGLIRLAKGRLLLTAAGRRALADPVSLWRSAAAAAVERGLEGAARDAALLLAVEACAARHADADAVLSAVADGLEELGWRHRDGTALDALDARDLTHDTWALFIDLGVFARGSRRREIGEATPGGRAFAAAMLRA